MLAARNADEQVPRPLTQQAIQCYTQNQIAGAAQATGRNARDQDAGGIAAVEGGTARRQSFEDDGGQQVLLRMRKLSIDRLLARAAVKISHRAGDDQQDDAQQDEVRQQHLSDVTPSEQFHESEYKPLQDD